MGFGGQGGYATPSEAWFVSARLNLRARHSKALKKMKTKEVLIKCCPLIPAVAKQNVDSIEGIPARTMYGPVVTMHRCTTFNELSITLLPI